MVRRSDPAEDDWHNITDAKKRKQVQDRLAQRARRKRLRDAKDNAKQQPETGRNDAPEGDESNNDASSSQLDLFSCNLRGMFQSESETSSSTGADLELPPFDIGNMPLCMSAMSARAFPSPNSQPRLRLTVYSALFINGEILGISCSTSFPARSNPPGPNVPPSLRPTEIQLNTIHPKFIDRFPCPKVRDSMVSLSGIFDEEDLVKDLFTIPSFELVPGKASWDPTAWRLVGQQFLEKWGFLFV